MVPLITGIPGVRLFPKLSILKLARNALHQSITVIDGRELVFGEYASNPGRQSIPLYRSTDSRRSWTKGYEFDAGATRHVHGCFWDPYEEKIWVATGDLNGECFIYIASRDVTDVVRLGDGSQAWRTVKIFFESDSCYWIMDSEYETSSLIRLSRKSRQIEKLRDFPGPVWYGKRTLGGIYLVATTVEHGPMTRSRESIPQGRPQISRPHMA